MIEIGRSTGDNEFLAVKAVFQGREISVINFYCPPDKERQLHTLPLSNQNVLIVGDFNGHSPSWGIPRPTAEGKT